MADKAKRRLSDINISHISLVKAGANGRTILFKSKEDTPTHEVLVKFTKQDDVKGIVYGIVYEPEKVDSQGDIANAEEIEKAAYAFMKARNTLNVDKEHDFSQAGAFVAESWIVKANDPIFPDAVGAWAVAIKVEDEALKADIKKGDIAGLSMAGIAKAETVSEEDGNILKSIKEGFETFIKAFEKSVSSKPTTITKDELNTLFKSELEPILKEKETLKVELTKAKDDLAAVMKEKDELVAELKKSKQTTDPTKIDTSDATVIAKAAQELVKKEEDAGRTLSVADAVAQLTKGAK
ncbi:MAG TPA: hypothetical protein CFH80_09635 [Sulfurospirillum cavolei]|uniref:Phage-like element PBSX protein XkdF domain-containing protein n=1 Tax=Sulfurospirillum cavolei TaxID=366522 RepID=A0A2D3WEP7_9BACT|nr:XkdF-like putative serine protease domain-containing protein [Sulfurospirillum cavolei]DAB35539.1 MAG TPA: hypothetical protein CFH80_09635 [Sulfurospirillum cavolei]